jgi:type VI protein secretion system component VasK
MASYVLFLSWPRLLVLALTVWAALHIRVPSSVSPWLYKTNKVLAVVLAAMYLAEAAYRAVRSWRRRRSRSATTFEATGTS